MFKVLVAIAVTLSACGGTDDTGTTEATPTTAVTPTTVATATTAAPDVTTTAEASALDSDCAHVVDATIESGSGGFTIAVTVLSGDTGWEKYADAWQVIGPDGEVLGERILAHPHETEQPFTRSLSGVEIPRDVENVTIAARDLMLGFCGEVLTVEVPHS